MGVSMRVTVTLVFVLLAHRFVGNGPNGKLGGWVCHRESSGRSGPLDCQLPGVTAYQVLRSTGDRGSQHQVVLGMGGDAMTFNR